MSVCAVGLLNAGLAAYTFQRQVDGEGAPLAECPDALIVATPGHAKLQAIVLIFDAEAVADPLPTTGYWPGVLRLLCEVDGAPAGDSPIAPRERPRRNPQDPPHAQEPDRR